MSVTYRSSTIPALRDASLTVHAGEIVGIAGPSGSGKSTLLRIASGIELPGSGTVLQPRVQRSQLAAPVPHRTAGGASLRIARRRTHDEPRIPQPAG